jgi:predicted component of viral defense system (DUF524 family)
VKVLPDGEPALTLSRSTDGRQVSIIPQRTFGRTSRGIRSISFGQKPDVVVEVSNVEGPPTLILFDPKYKLRSEDQTVESDALEDTAVPWGHPKKVDIDRMHAYRDSIRDEESEQRVVEYAAILYPGPEKRFPPGIEALTANPLHSELLRDRVRSVLSSAIA